MDFEWDDHHQQCINPDYYISEGQLFCTSEDGETVLNIVKAVAGIDHDNLSFAFFDLEFSKEDYDILEKLVINEEGWGGTTLGSSQLQRAAVTSTIKSLTGRGENDLVAPDMAKLITNLVTTVSKAVGYDHSDVKIHAVGPSTKDTFPVWHIDKSFEEVVGDKNAPCSHSFIFTLKGDSTIFLPTTSKAREEFYAKSKENEYTYEYDPSLVNATSTGLEILNNSITYSTELGQGAVFSRCTQHGTIHTGPENKDRIYIVVTPMSKETLDRFHNYYDKQWMKWLSDNNHDIALGE